MYQELTDRLTSGVARCVTEEEVRFLWLSELKSALGVQFQAERERNDAYYNGVVIEFKNAGLFGGVDAFRLACARLLGFVLALASPRLPSRW